MSEASPASAAARNEAAPTSPPVPVQPIVRSRPYLKVMWFIPGLVMLAVGLFFYYNVETGGEVTAIKLTTRKDMVGQAAEAKANFDPRTPGKPSRTVKPALVCR